MTNQELKISATYIKKLASFPDAEDRISLYLDSLFAAQPQKDTFNVQENKKTMVSSILQFTQKEINQMPKTFKKEFRTNGCTAHVRRRKTSKNCYLYDIRYRRNGYNILVTNKDLETAKRLFIEKFKVSPKEYIIQARINYACDLLPLKLFNIKQVAEQCGFRDPAFFSREFKKYVGSSPRDFISRHKSSK